MSLLKTVHENEATNVTKQVYDGFAGMMGRVPNVIKFHTASTLTYPYMMGMLNEFANHPNLDQALITYLRVIVPYRYRGEYCVKFQSFLLKGLGESDENIEIAKKDPTKLPMDEKRKSLLVFALDILDENYENVEGKLEKVKSYGWTDQDIYEFCMLGGFQKGMIPLVTGFKVEHDF